jgi:hypothetical protein
VEKLSASFTNSAACACDKNCFRHFDIVWMLNLGGGFYNNDSTKVRISWRVNLIQYFRSLKHWVCTLARLTQKPKLAALTTIFVIMKLLVGLTTHQSDTTIGVFSGV